MDVLTIILRTVREAIHATGAPPDPLQTALEEAERLLRRRVGGTMHHISRSPEAPTKSQIIDLAADLTPQQIAGRLGVSDRYVRRVLQQLRDIKP